MHLKLVEGMTYARTRNLEACTARPASGQITVDASRRVRARGNPSRARRQTRRRLGETGDCDRVVESAARRRQAPAAKNRIRANEEASRTRDRAREARSEASFTTAVARLDAASAPARTRRRESYGAGTTSQTRSASSRCPCTFGSRKTRGQDSIGPLNAASLNLETLGTGDLRTEDTCQKQGPLRSTCTLAIRPTL